MSLDPNRTPPNAGDSAPGRGSSAPIQFMKENGPKLAAHLIGGLLSWAFAAGIFYASVNSKFAAIDRRLEEIDRAEVMLTKWRGEQNTVAIQGNQLRSERTQADISRIESRLSGIEANTNSLLDAVKHRDRP